MLEPIVFKNSGRDFCFLIYWLHNVCRVCWCFASERLHLCEEVWPIWCLRMSASTIVASFSRHWITVHSEGFLWPTNLLKPLFQPSQTLLVRAWPVMVARWTFQVSSLNNGSVRRNFILPFMERTDLKYINKIDNNFYDLERNLRRSWLGFNAVFNIDNITYTVNKNRLRIEGRSVISQKTFTLSKEDQLYLKTDTFWKSHFYIGDICYIDNIIYTAEKRRLHFQRRISYISKDVYAIKGGSVISQKTFTHSKRISYITKQIHFGRVLFTLETHMLHW